MEKSFFKYLAALAVLLCNCDNKYIPSRVEPVQIDFVRFDSAVLAADSHKDGVNLLYKDFGPFMTVFSQDIIGVDANDTAYMKEALPKFLNDTLYGFKQTNNKVREQFADIYPIEDDIIYGFSRLKYLFPQIILPEVTFFVSGFNASLLFWNGDFDTQEIRIAIGLDMYLGQDYELYNKVVYNYQKQGMNPECIPLDIMSAYLFRVFEYDGEKNRLIDNMIYRGKLMYVISLLYDKTPAYEVMGYTKEQWNWAKKNESNLYRYIIERKHLFSSERNILTAYLTDGPFCSEVSQQCPARIGIWLGWQIAESFLKHNNNISLQSFILNNDTEYLLEHSYYKP